MKQLEQEGGPEGKWNRLRASQKKLVKVMRLLGFKTLLPDELHSPIITTFLYHKMHGFTFEKVYAGLKEKSLIIYPGKVTKADTFRLGNIGEVYVEDIDKLLEAVRDTMREI